MPFFAKICHVKFRRSKYCVLSLINFVLLMIATTTPLLLWYRFPTGFFIRGLWTVCDHLGCTEILVADAYVDTARALSVAAGFMGLFALISSWKLLTLYAKYEVLEILISCMANFSTAVFLLYSLLITYLNLRTEVDIKGNRLAPFCGFYIGCFVCFLSILLGIYSVLELVGLIEEKEKLNTEENTEQKEAALVDCMASPM